MRYSTTERLGVNATEKVVLDIDWIFREQLAVDVGIDAFIEQSEGGQPTGKFIAVQIKSGERNFHVSHNFITYYVSNIHYYYWLSLNIPIILVAYLPETDEIYWELIEKPSLIKTKTRWRLKIPKQQVFGSSAKNELTKILSKKFRKNILSEVYEYDFESDLLDDFEFFPETEECINKIRKLNILHSQKLKAFTGKLKSLFENEAKIKILLKVESKYLTSYSMRLENEVNLFSKFFAEELYVLQQLINQIIGRKIKVDSALINSIILFIEEITKLIRKLEGEKESMKELILTYPAKYSVMKKGMKSLLIVYDLQVEEYVVAKEDFKKILAEIT